MTGTGDMIQINLEFTAPVNVSDNPRLVVNSGCYYPNCVVPEIQSFTCYADIGKFGFRYLDSFVMNIDVNTTQVQFKTLLEVSEKTSYIIYLYRAFRVTFSLFAPIISKSLPGINSVTVRFSEGTDREYSFGERICTSKGKETTVTFDAVDLPQFFGDVPPLFFDPLNGAKGGFVDLRSGFQIGDGTTLAGFNVGYTAQITSPSNEIQKGLKQPDGYADYLSGSGTTSTTKNRRHLF